jgi:hypothetical protein
VALAAIADHRDLLGLDEIKIGVPIVINAHGMSLAGVSTPASSRGRAGAKTAEPIGAF